mgnify:CR=1 FL=1
MAEMTGREVTATYLGDGHKGVHLSPHGAHDLLVLVGNFVQLRQAVVLTNDS